MDSRHWNTTTYPPTSSYTSTSAYPPSSLHYPGSSSSERVPASYPAAPYTSYPPAPTYATTNGYPSVSSYSPDPSSYSPTPSYPATEYDLAWDTNVNFQDFSHPVIVPASLRELEAELQHWRNLSVPLFSDSHLSANHGSSEYYLHRLETRKLQIVQSVIARLNALTQLPPLEYERAALLDDFREFGQVESEISQMMLETMDGSSAGEESYSPPHRSGYSSPPPYDDPYYAHSTTPSGHLHPHRHSRTSSHSHRPTSSSSQTLDVYICPEGDCNQSFKRLNALNRHISSIHRNEGVTCPFCPQPKRRFNRSDNFQRHVTGRHQEIGVHNELLQSTIRRLYQGDGRRTSWRKD